MSTFYPQVKTVCIAYSNKSMLGASSGFIQRNIGRKRWTRGWLKGKVVLGSLNEEFLLQGTPEQLLFYLSLSQPIATVTPDSKCDRRIGGHSNMGRHSLSTGKKKKGESDADAGRDAGEKRRAVAWCLQLPSNPRLLILLHLACFSEIVDRLYRSLNLG